MTSSIVLNETLMKKERLRAAFDTIQIIADNGFVEDSLYKRSHQVLLERIKQLEYEEEHQRGVLRRVEDVIPNSYLAKYGNYPYNEYRERSYTPHTSGPIAVHPNLGKIDYAHEPWMLPAVEDLFIHTLYSATTNYKLYENELQKMIECGDVTHELFPCYKSSEGQKSSTSSLDCSLERSPPRSTSFKHDQPNQDFNADKDLPYYFKVNEYEGYRLRTKLLSDEVKNVWYKRETYSREHMLEVYKSLMDNVIINQESEAFRYILKPDDYALQKLVAFILDLNNKIPPPTDHDDQDPNTALLNETTRTPTRRLYSDVVQGTNMAPKTSKSLHEPCSPKSSYYTDEFSSGVNSSTGFLHPESTTKSSTEFNDRLHAQPSMSELSYFEIDTPRVPEIGDIINANPPRKQSPNKFSYSEAVNNTCGYPINQFNMPFLNDEVQPKTNNTSGTYPSTSYNPMQYHAETTSYTGNPNYNRLGYSISNPTYPPQTYQVPLNRTQNVNPSWYISPPYRPAHQPSPYSMVVLPQLPTKHRWTNPQYMRPNTPTTSMYNPSTSQNPPVTWPHQPAAMNINRSGSNQQVNTSGFSGYDPTKNKKKNIAPTTTKFPRSKSPDQGMKNKKFVKGSTSGATPTTYPSKILTKPHSDFRIMARQDGDRASCADPPIPVNYSASDELEKIALREYQPSVEGLFNEIERQAEEQYDGNPENSCRPPNSGNDQLLVGGLRALNFVFQLYFSINTR